ncbi:MAG: hypothetical protein HUK25_03270 [Treponema sp.]|nr:hypothetical protein [Treponema sp.]
MFKKSFLAVCAVIFTVSAATAVTPAVGGENLFDLSSPFSLSYGSSVAGGGVYFVNPTSITINPALNGRDQRVGLNAGYTALVTVGDSQSFGSAVQTGITIPFKWAVFSGYLNGTFPNTNKMGLSNSASLKAALSKEISERLAIGLGINGGFEWGPTKDWALSGNIGMVYTIPNLGFIKDFRYGVSILNLGKNFNPADDSEFFDGYPGFATIRTGVAGLLFSNDVIKVGASFDVSTPCFTNLLMDAGLQLIIKDSFTISVADKFNLVETVNGNLNIMPSVGFFFKFKFNVSDNAYLASRDWNESEMTVGGAWKNMYSDVHAVSGELNLSLGLKDETPPVIMIWFDEDEE